MFYQCFENVALFSEIDWDYSTRCYVWPTPNSAHRRKCNMPTCEVLLALSKPIQLTCKLTKKSAFYHPVIKNLTGKWKHGTVSLAVRIRRKHKNSLLHVFQLKPSKVLEKATQKASQLWNLNYLCPELALKQETSLLLSVQYSPRGFVPVLKGYVI